LLCCVKKKRKKKKKNIGTWTTPIINYVKKKKKKDLGVMTPESNDDVEKLGLGTPFFQLCCVVLCCVENLGLGTPFFFQLLCCG